MHPIPILSVDLTALTDNWRLLRDTQAKKHSAAVVKADAYGLGMAPVARALRDAGCDTFFVATLQEGLALRAALENAEIYVFHGPFPGEETDYLAHCLRPVLNTPDQINRWAKALRDTRQPQAASAALHVDTGMTRLGLSEGELAAYDPAALVRECRITLLMSHLACASEPDHPLNAGQLRRMEQVRQFFPVLPVSFVNSAGHFLAPEFHYDLGRPGCSLYGITPNPAQPNPMRHVATLSGPVIQLRAIERDGHIGYGAATEVRRGMKVAVIALGYADGLHRIGSHRLPGYIGGHCVPMLGRISMDMTCFDVTDVPPSLLEGVSSVSLICEQQPVDTVAEICRTIGYEIFTRIGSRVRREYVE